MLSRKDNCLNSLLAFTSETQVTGWGLVANFGVVNTCLPANEPVLFSSVRDLRGFEGSVCGVHVFARNVELRMWKPEFARLTNPGLGLLRA
jgi:hypothetical protein